MFRTERIYGFYATPVQHMRIDHRSLEVLVTEKFLNSPDIVAAFQELRGEGMTECVAGGSFGQADPFHRAVDHLSAWWKLFCGIGEMMARQS